ncbi:hypothetical protein J437_LFUL008478 [Ladona fulva]|uniref:Uncharacterized protein n=1 Tax=Ladona fulva TaxID=123851 RepID=A0A8K0K5E5_LADFU|nr:hypothetical protein J437_LFUL008478 [Ladona fulva]
MLRRLKWSPHEDYFTFRVNLLTSQSVITKRTILSQIAKLFHPLGFGDIRSRLGYSNNRQTERHLCFLRKQLLTLEDLKIPRWFGGNLQDHWQLYGFCDASEQA